MCGRAAQTYTAIQAAANTLRTVGNCNIVQLDDNSSNNNNSKGLHNEHNYRYDNSNITNPDVTDDALVEYHDDGNNYNMSPGMDAVVFWIDHHNHNKTGNTLPSTKDTTTPSCTSDSPPKPKIQVTRMIWGLLSQNGTSTKPLERGMNKHFTNLMYNARCDTLHEKKSFHHLCNTQQSCLIALEGYFEWKMEMGQKQPYFVYRNSNNSNTESTTSSNTSSSYLLVAGLWKRIQTGWSDQPTINTFTILTTEVCPPIQWLHTRMPVLIWDITVAIQWLHNPSSQYILQNQLVLQSQQTTSSQLQWHKVTKNMSSMKLRTITAILPYHDKQQSVKSYFTTATGKKYNTTTKTTTYKKKDEGTIDLESLDYPVGCTTMDENTGSKHSMMSTTATTTTNPYETKKRKLGGTTTTTNTSMTTTKSASSSIGTFSRSPVKKKASTLSTTTTTTTTTTTPMKKSNQSSIKLHNNTTRTIDSFFSPKQK